MRRKTFMKTGVAAMAAFLTLLAPAHAQTGSTGTGSSGSASGSPGASATGSSASSQAKISARDRKFMKEAAQGGLAEVQLGQLATTNAADPDVKAFGQRMVTDHTKANDQLKQIAAALNVTLPADLSAADKAEVKRLSKLSGASFDRVYVREMVKDHKKDVAEFAKEAKSGHGEVKSFASTTLPILQEHLKMAQDLQAKLGGGKSGSRHKSSTGR